MAGNKRKTQNVKRKAKKSKPRKGKKLVAKKVAKKVIKRKKSPKKKLKKPVKKAILQKFKGNPIIGPVHGSYWESAAAFNPAAIVLDDRVHLFYRALGPDGISRIGYASSRDGIHFDQRCIYPVFAAENVQDARRHHPYTSPARLVFDTTMFASGGGWGGCGDPRAVDIEGRVYLTFNMFNGWDSMRVAFTSIDKRDILNCRWNWSKFAYLSRSGDRQKNWVLFPEKFGGKFALLHNIDKGDPARVHIAYLNNLDISQTPSQSEAPDIHTLPDHLVAWHNRTRSASAPPIKTKDGWLLFYHAMDKNDPGRYKVGALLLDLNDPSKVLYRSTSPLLEPNEWYENDWKPGIVYANGAVVKDGTLFIYYGGGDKHIGVAHTRLDTFLTHLKNNEHIVLSLDPAPIK